MAVGPRKSFEEGAGLIKILVIGKSETATALSKALSKLSATIYCENNQAQIKKKLLKNKINIIFLDADDVWFENGRKTPLEALFRKSGKPFIVLSSQKKSTQVIEAYRRGASDTLTKPLNQRELIMRLNALLLKKTRLTCIGGGTGLFTLLLGLKTLPNFLLTSIVSMSDDGGSSGKLSQTFGILPPGDVRRSLVALSNAPEVMNQIVQHRFDKGDLRGHSFGNIFLTVLAEVKGSMAEAVRALSDILNIQGIVLPASHSATQLVARFADRTVIKGESRIDLGEGRDPDLRVRKIWHEPAADCASDALSSIFNSDIVTIGPGDLFTSVIANLAIKDLAKALVQTRAKKIYICNLMTKPGETAHFNAEDHVREILKYLGKDCLDAVLISDTRVSEESLLEYAKKHQKPVEIGDLRRLKKMTKAEIIVADIGHETELVRHDSLKLKNEIQRLVKRWGIHGVKKRAR